MSAAESVQEDLDFALFLLSQVYQTSIASLHLSSAFSTSTQTGHSAALSMKSDSVQTA